LVNFFPLRISENDEERNERWMNCFSDYSWCLVISLPKGSAAFQLYAQVFVLSMTEEGLTST